MTPRLSSLDFATLHAAFDAPISPLDCGTQCAVFNPDHIPVCCDICAAVPVAYQPEWTYLKANTSLWHLWRGDECAREQADRAPLEQLTPSHLYLLACQGPASCDRFFRSVSCRQFPFYPYFTSDFRFIGMTYDWEFRHSCWVISNLAQVTLEYRSQFFSAFDQIFSTWLEDMESYIELSAETREHYQALHRRIPLLHRNGQAYLVSPASERLTRISPQQLPRFTPY